MIKTGEGCKKPSSVFSIFTRPITAIKMTDAPLYTPSGEHCSQSEIEALHELILLNDQENTFCHVIESLIRVCGHEEHRLMRSEDSPSGCRHQAMQQPKTARIILQDKLMFVF